MKISFMTFMTPEWTLDEVIAGARRHGYDGVEPRVTAKHKHGIEPDMPAAARKEARERFADAGIEIACIATSCTFAATDPAKRQANVDNLKRHIELAADLGALGIRVFGGVRPEGLSMPDAIAMVAEDLSKGCSQACDAGVGVWLETHDHFSRAEDAAAVIERTNCACLGINWDLMHPYRNGETTTETWGFLKQGAVVRHTHLHDGVEEESKVRLVPIGEGRIPFHEPLRLLKSIGYEGYLSAEYWAELGGPDESLSRYMTSVRRLLSEI
ncbi:MAG TPA: sugar phosphate isomerase/epimerase [Armatimonadetes bacterium]|jgi:sugar phosphate isomerase/epimerase|nr:sugar phosphate isomerase/epimerase [Armatimonadota bacterium]